MRRSLFGLVGCYNLLPQKVVNCKTVKTFQKHLQNALKAHAAKVEGPERWQRLYSTGWKGLSRKALDELFA